MTNEDGLLQMRIELMLPPFFRISCNLGTLCP